MFNDVLVVSTAISSFNNAALQAPYFLATAILSAPLFWLVFVYGHDILAKIGWIERDIVKKTGFWSVLCIVLWLLIFGGNYEVIRDNITLLPVALSGVLFISTIYIVNQFFRLDYLSKIPNNKKIIRIAILLLLLIIAFSAFPTWWGILLQVSAFICGIIVGARIKTTFNPITTSAIIMMIVSTLILMQPEYFRFGQLGNLTIFHLIALLFCGFCFSIIMALRYINARGGIYDSAYIKIKWFFRIVSLLSIFLFVVTESVPVFICCLGAMFFNFALTIYHRTQKSNDLYKQSWALLLICFGMITICPIISVFGILILANMTNKIRIKDFKKLL